MAKNIVIEGLPGTGKSTLLKLVLDSYDGMTAGLITTEIKENEKRVGFKMGIHYKGANENPFARTIAHIGINSEISVSKYRINVSEINKQASNEKKSSFGMNYLLYLDEVGEMQSYSKPFTDLAETYLGTQNLCIMTVSKKYKSNFIDAIKNREDVELIELTLENRNDMKAHILNRISEFVVNRKNKKDEEQALVDSSNRKKVNNLIYTCDCGDGKSGIMDLNSLKVFCHCNEENADIILDAIITKYKF